MIHERPIPIIAIDGTSSSGKGTVAYKLAKHFGFNYLNSGALYRLVAYIAMENRIAFDDTEGLVMIAENLHVTFDGKDVIYNGVNVWPTISGEEMGMHASVVSRVYPLRDALLERQRAMAQAPGLVAEGRDMCTRVFSHAQVKLYLDADVVVRAKRRLGDELDAGHSGTLDAMVDEIRERDHRDMNKEVGRLYPADDAKIIDNSNYTREETLLECIAWCEAQGVEVAQ